MTSARSRQRYRHWRKATGGALKGQGWRMRRTLNRMRRRDRQLGGRAGSAIGEGLGLLGRVLSMFAGRRRR